LATQFKEESKIIEAKNRIAKLVLLFERILLSPKIIELIANHNQTANSRNFATLTWELLQKNLSKNCLSAAVQNYIEQSNNAQGLSILLSFSGNTQFIYNNGNNALHLAIIYGRTDLIELLALHNEISQNNDNETPVLLAAKFNHPGILLNLRNPIPYGLADKYDKLPIDYVQKNDSIECLIALIYLKFDIFALNELGRNALSIAIPGTEVGKLILRIYGKWGSEKQDLKKEAPSPDETLSILLKLKNPEILSPSALVYVEKIENMCKPHQASKLQTHCSEGLHGCSVYIRRRKNSATSTSSVGGSKPSSPDVRPAEPVFSSSFTLVPGSIPAPAGFAAYEAGRRIEKGTQQSLHGRE
jgi:hypothetical protein